MIETVYERTAREHREGVVARAKRCDPLAGLHREWTDAELALAKQNQEEASRLYRACVARAPVPVIEYSDIPVRHR
jgi:hypothetical protein